MVNDECILLRVDFSVVPSKGVQDFLRLLRELNVKTKGFMMHLSVSPSCNVSALSPVVSVEHQPLKGIRAGTPQTSHLAQRPHDCSQQKRKPLNDISHVAALGSVYPGDPQHSTLTQNARAALQTNKRKLEFGSTQGSLPDRFARVSMLSSNVIDLDDDDALEVSPKIILISDSDSESEGPAPRSPELMLRRSWPEGSPVALTSPRLATDGARQPLAELTLVQPPQATRPLALPPSSTFAPDELENVARMLPMRGSPNVQASNDHSSSPVVLKQKVPKQEKQNSIVSYLSSPVLHTLSTAKSSDKAQFPKEWLKVRKAGTSAYRELRADWNRRGITPDYQPKLTDLIYEGLFGKSRRELIREKGLKDSQNVRDYMEMKDLRALRKLETTILKRMASRPRIDPLQYELAIAREIRKLTTQQAAPSVFPQRALAAGRSASL